MALVLLAALVPTASLVSVLARSPFPLSETVALLEDVAQQPATAFLAPSSAYYRPLFHGTLSAMWHASDSVRTTLRLIRLLHVIPLILLLALFLWCLRPRTAIDAAAATVGVAVLIGSPGLLGNLELPLSYTIVGMPAGLMTWMLLEQKYRRWHGPAVIALAALAIGFKEQGLVLVPLVILAWAMGARGVGRPTVLALTAAAGGYVAFRLVYHSAGAPLFEQDVGVGFGAIAASEAEARFRTFPWAIFAYNSTSTISNVLFAEPTEGVFRIVRALVRERVEPWHVVHLTSSCLLTGLIGWWGVAAIRSGRVRPWPHEARLAAALVVVLLACGALSFSYSRDRLGGMAVPFYAMAAYAAVRAAALRASSARPAAAAAAGLLLLCLAATWQMRATYTIEFARHRALTTHREWITALGTRREEFADRPTYLAIMGAMTKQGTASPPVRPTRYPQWVVSALGEF